MTEPVPQETLGDYIQHLHLQAGLPSTREIGDATGTSHTWAALMVKGKIGRTSWQRLRALVTYLQGDENRARALWKEHVHVLDQQRDEQPLRAHNDHSALLDVHEKLLDAAACLRQLMEEQQHEENQGMTNEPENEHLMPKPLADLMRALERGGMNEHTEAAILDAAKAKLRDSSSPHDRLVCVATAAVGLSSEDDDFLARSFAKAARLSAAAVLRQAVSELRSGHLDTSAEDYGPDWQAAHEQICDALDSWADAIDKQDGDPSSDLE